MSETRYRQKLLPKTTENGQENEANGFLGAQTNENNVTSDNRLYKIEEMPEYLRFNPFVKDGYRRQMNVKECCQSLLFFHNETVNIYTHGKRIVFAE
jgi:adiponectin receptor